MKIVSRFIKRISQYRFIQLLYFEILIPLLIKLPVPSTVFGPVKGRHPSYAQWVSQVEKDGYSKDANPKQHTHENTHWIRLLQGAQDIHETSPVLAIPQIPDDFRRASIHHVPDIFLAHLHWGRLALSNFEVIAPDDKVFDDFFFPPPQENFTAKSMMMPRLPRLKRIFGSYATFVNYRAFNYYHWVIHCLSRLWVLDESGIDSYRLLVPTNLVPFQQQYLDLLGFSNNQLEPFDNEHWLLEHLYVPSYPMAPRHVSKDGCHWLRNRVLSSTKNFQNPFPRRIYISRAQTSQRRLTNESDLMKLLERYRFCQMNCETMSVKHQINLFREAEVVIAPHGAGLTNILFMKAGSLIIELVPSRKSKPYYCNLASAMGLKYVCITDAPEEENQPKTPLQSNNDFNIPIERVVMALQILGL